MICYFSGTGNSRYLAGRFQQACGDNLICINDQIKKGLTASEIHDERLIFVLPTYAWRIPRIAEEWIRRSSFPSACKAWFIMNCGSEIGNADKYLRRLCNEKTLSYMGVAQIIMPENYLALFPVPSDEKAVQIVSAAQPSIEAAISFVKRSLPFPETRPNLHDRLSSSLINPLFYTFIVKAHAFHCKSSCIHCGQCVRICPLNNIQLENKLPKWGKKCTHCMACITHCPVQAIEYGKKSAGQPRYTFEKSVFSANTGKGKEKTK